MENDKAIQEKVEKIFEENPELNDPQRVIQLVWRYFEIVGNKGKPIIYIMKEQWEHWQMNYGTVESIIRAARKVRDKGQNELSLKHYNNYKK